ncbi:MAG: hypothetical protein PHW32_02600 [Bacilli bacterium]|nr:hypothetical protein [Bacilli bacterium]MDD4718386.1 hypothetical protein [Bacilli bacterium]
MNKLYIKNSNIELILIMILSFIGLYYGFERIIVFTAIIIFGFENFYSKCRNKDVLVNKSFELVKRFIYIYMAIIIIRYFSDPMLLYGKELMDRYLFNRLSIVLLLYGGMLLYKTSHKQVFEKNSFDKDINITNKLLYISLISIIVHININFHNNILLKLILVILHLIIIKNIDTFYLKFLIIFVSIVSLISGNYISAALLFICYLNLKEKNKKTLESELEDIKNIDVS